jgi:TRAP-type mannitol/chloroaromatic compound transport system permease small subunit
VQRFCHVIDTLNEWIGRIVSWFLIPLVLIGTTEVVARYVFKRPQVWSWEVSMQIMAGLVVLGGGWGLLKNWHVRIDVLWARLPQRKKVMLDLITFPLFLFTFSIILWESASAALVSVQFRERFSSYFASPIYPLKIIVVLGFFLMLLQGIIEFIRNLSNSGKE